MAIRANNWINDGMQPLKPYQWLYWEVEIANALYEDIKQDWALTNRKRMEEVEAGIRYKYGKLIEALDKLLISPPVPLDKVPKLKSFLLEWKETAKEQMKFIIQMDVENKEDLSYLADLYYRMDKVIGGATLAVRELVRKEDLKNSTNTI